MAFLWRVILCYPIRHIVRHSRWSEGSAMGSGEVVERLIREGPVARLDRASRQLSGRSDVRIVSVVSANPKAGFVVAKEEAVGLSLDWPHWETWQVVYGLFHVLCSISGPFGLYWFDKRYERRFAEHQRPDESSTGYGIPWRILLCWSLSIVSAGCAGRAADKGVPWDAIERLIREGLP